MFSTANFKTKTIFTKRKNEDVDGIWAIALDIGYSAVKGFSNNSVFCFPSYARKITSQILSFDNTQSNDIQYRDDETNEIWAVGSSAQDMIVSGEARDSIMELYGRNRYFSEIFKVITRVGMGIGMLNDEYGYSSRKKIMLQTGLPPAYLRSDTALLKDALSGLHKFSIKFGNQEWVSFNFVLPMENIFVMPQPMGTLLSVSTDNKGKQIQDAVKYFKSSVLIFDPGFGTLDVFNMRNSLIESTETFDNLGMKRVLEETINLILAKYQQEISIPEMQKYLLTGQIKCHNRKNRSTSMVSFADLLSDANKKTCYEALSKIDNIYNGLYDHDYLIITGGTGAAWNEIIRDYYKDMKTLKIVSGNQNDNLPYIFSNVRGYYLYLVNKLKKENL